MFFTKTRDVLLARHVCSAGGLCAQEQQPGRAAPSQTRARWARLRGAISPVTAQKSEGTGCLPERSCMREHAPTGSSGLVAAGIYACSYRQKAGAFLYLQKNGGKLESSVMGPELWPAIPSSPSASFWLQLCLLCRRWSRSRRWMCSI